MFVTTKDTINPILYFIDGNKPIHQHLFCEENENFQKNVTKCQPMISVSPFPFKLIDSIIFSHRILFSFNLHCYMACKINNEHP